MVCNTRDFGIGRRVTAENWKVLRAVGDAANQRLCDAQADDARPAPDVATFTDVTRPSNIDGQYAPGLAALDLRIPPEFVPRSPLAIAWRQFDCALDNFINKALTTA